MLFLPDAGIARAGRGGELFPSEVQVSDNQLILTGRGVLRYKRIIPVYDAALYLPAGVGPDRALDRVARRLEVVYRTGARAKRFADAGDIVLARSFPPETLNVLQDRLDRINSLYPDPEKGDRCAITYVPDKGTELSFNAASLGWIEGDDFAEAYFSIWLGDHPASTALRDHLLDPETVR